MKHQVIKVSSLQEIPNHLVLLASIKNPKQTQIRNAINRGAFSAYMMKQEGKKYGSYYVDAEAADRMVAELRNQGYKKKRILTAADMKKRASEAANRRQAAGPSGELAKWFNVTLNSIEDLRRKVDAVLAMLSGHPEFRGYVHSDADKEWTSKLNIEHS